MIGTPPSLYFRIRDNGAAVFEVDAQNRNGRLELTQIAVANVKNGEIKTAGDRQLTETEEARIRDWIASRRDVLAARDADDAERTVEALNRTALWAQQRATPNELERVTDALLLAMHDLRDVLVRKAADRLASEDDQADLR